MLKNWMIIIILNMADLMSLNLYNIQLVAKGSVVELMFMGKSETDRDKYPYESVIRKLSGQINDVQIWAGIFDAVASSEVQIWAEQYSTAVQGLEEKERFIQYKVQNI